MTNSAFDDIKWTPKMKAAIARNRKSSVVDVIYVGFRDRCILVDEGDKNEQGLPILHPK